MNLPDTVKYFMVLDPRAGSERFVLALEGPKGERRYVGRGCERSQAEQLQWPQRNQWERGRMQDSLTGLSSSSRGRSDDHPKRGPAKRCAA